jgi:hypothetical protein
MKVLSTTSKPFPKVLEMVASGKLSFQDVSEICIISRPAEVILMQAEEERTRNELGYNLNGLQ